MSNLLKNLLLVLGLSAIIWFGYSFIKEDEPVAGTETANQAALETQEFLARLQILKSINIDGKIFSDIRFTSLVDLRQQILPEPTGRNNPFAPLQ